MRSAVQFNASFVSGFHFKSFELALHTVIVKQFAFIKIEHV